MYGYLVNRLARWFCTSYKHSPFMANDPDLSNIMRTYEVETHLERGWWIINISDVRQRTQAPTLTAVVPTARFLIAKTLDISPTSFMIDVHVSRLSGADVVHARLRANDVEPPSEASRNRSRMLRRRSRESTDDVAPAGHRATP